MDETKDLITSMLYGGVSGGLLVSALFWSNLPFIGNAWFGILFLLSVFLYIKYVHLRSKYRSLQATRFDELSTIMNNFLEKFKNETDTKNVVKQPDNVE